METIVGSDMTSHRSYVIRDKSQMYEVIQTVKKNVTYLEY